MDKPEWVTNEPEWLADCRAVTQCAHDLIEGRKGVIESARVLRRLAYKVRDEWDTDFVFFRGIDSESDHLPVGGERQHWSAPRLEREDEKIRAYEDERR
ncbi:MAG TPA: hypothetical protein VL997_04890, partial [Dyella sp.]|nr:hypothetical protein [Dyella sp.]